MLMHGGDCFRGSRPEILGSGKAVGRCVWVNATFQCEESFLDSPTKQKQR